MSDIDIIQDRTISESNDDDDGTKKAQEISLFLKRANSVTEQVNVAINYHTTSDKGDQLKQHRIRKDLRDKISFNQIRRTADNEIINYAYHSIADALDYEIDRIERSNLFDEWKDTLESIIVEVTNVSVNHRKILGAIIVATKGKDITDFTIEELNILRDATYMFRQLRVTGSDSKRTIKRLIGISADMAIPLTADGISDKDEEGLNQLMRSLIKRGK